MHVINEEGGAATWSASAPQTQNDDLVPSSSVTAPQAIVKAEVVATSNQGAVDSSAYEDKDYNTLVEERIKELLFKAAEEQLPAGFYYENGQLMHRSQDETQGAPQPGMYISSRLNVKACTRDDNHVNHGRLLEFRDVDGIHHEWAMPMDMLAGDGAHYREELLNMGLDIAPGLKQRQLLTHFIQASRPSARARCVQQTGWYKSSFVLPNEVIGPLPPPGQNNEEKVILQTVSGQFPSYDVAGTVDEWKDHVASLCVGNSRLILAVSIAFAPPLLHLLQKENGGFHFCGPSSIGKTTALRVAASVWGGNGYVQRWRATANGLEAIAASHNDALLCLDEMSQVDPDEAGEIAYMLANGSGKARADRHGGSKKKATWRLLFFSTGEISLNDHMGAAGKKARAGQEVRLIDLVADTGKFGLFEDLHGYANASIFAQELTKACASYHGAPAREFINKLINDRYSPSDVAGQMADLMPRFVEQKSDGQVYRVAERFVLVAAAGELATVFGITGWTPGTATKAAQRCFQLWLEGRGGSGSYEEQKILDQTRNFFQLHGESRFTPWTQSEHEFEKCKTLNKTGYRKLSEIEGIEYFVYPEIFKAEIAKGYAPKQVGDILVKHGLLKPGSNGEHTRSESLPHHRKNIRCYRFTSKVMGNEAEGGANE